MTLVACAASTSYVTFSTGNGATVSRRPRGLVAARRLPLSVVRAEGGSQTPAGDDDDARVEALEAAVRSRKGMGAFKAQGAEQRRSMASQGSSSGGFADWNEGDLFPQGWEQMDPIEKVSNLYMGKRGFLFWANKAALASVIGIAGFWIIFRLVLPALGVYQLQNDLLTPSF